MWERRVAARLTLMHGRALCDGRRRKMVTEMLETTSCQSSAGSLATNTHRTDFFLVSFWPGEQDILATSRNMTPFI